jgi:hypothetical protein
MMRLLACVIGIAIETTEMLVVRGATTITIKSPLARFGILS